MLSVDTTTPDSHSEEVVSSCSERRLAANRANAQLSTGPRTVEGKAMQQRRQEQARLRQARPAALAAQGQTVLPDTNGFEFTNSWQAELTPLPTHPKEQ